MRVARQATRARAAATANGFALVALLVAIAILSIMLLVALPTWRHQVQREKEAELVFRGEQYVRAIGLYQRRFAGASPPNLDLLVEQKFLRKKYKDPMTGEDFVPVYANSPEAREAMRRAVESSRAAVQVRRGAGPRGQETTTMTFQDSVEVRFPDGSRGAVRGPGTISINVQRGGAAGIVGVMSKSTAESIRLYNGRNHYNEWIFVSPVVFVVPDEGQPIVPGQRGRGSVVPDPQRGSGRQSGFGPAGRGRGRGQ